MPTVMASLGGWVPLVNLDKGSTRPLRFVFNKLPDQKEVNGLISYGMRSGYGGYFSLDLVRSGAPAAHNVSIGSEQKGYIHATILHADPVG